MTMVYNEIVEQLSIAIDMLSNMTETRCMAFGDSVEFIGIREICTLERRDAKTQIFLKVVIPDSTLEFDEDEFTGEMLYNKIIYLMSNKGYKAPVVVIEDARLVGFKIQVKYAIKDRFNTY
jgi:hypothetical protein